MKLISDREIRVATLSGAVVLFTPGVEREVSDEIGLLAMQQGAKQLSAKAEPAPAPVIIQNNPDVEAYEPVATIDDVVAGVEKLVELSNPDDFKADGTPKASAVNRVVGRNVSSEDREAAWTAFLNS